jgi:predicted nucleic acid-binding protein
MTPVLVDSNVLLDVVTEDDEWGEWSASALGECAEESVLVINPIIYSEVSIGFPTIEELEDVLPPEYFRREPIPWEAAFLAGKCFVKYRRRRGTRVTTLPDFFIGAHAAVREYRLLTRDDARFRTYFPSVELFAP